MAAEATMTRLQGLLEGYRAMEPVRELLARMQDEFGDEKRWASLEFQVRKSLSAFNDRAAQVMAVVVNDPICDDFAPQKKYTYRFLKSYLDAIEAVGGDVDDELAEKLLEFVLHPKVLQDTVDADSMHHVSFSVPTAEKPTVVTCRVASVFNEVGLKLWEAGWLLAEYVMAYPTDFQGRSVLELGAGVGFSGMVLACVSEPKRVVLTDYAPKVMQNLRYNMEINAHKFRCPVEVQALDWDTWQPSQDPGERDRPDILLAGDCVYDVGAFPSLMRVLQAFLGGLDSGEAQLREAQKRVAIFASTIRNRKTFQAFLDQLEAHHIDYEDITATALATMGEQIFSYPNRAQIRLCRLSRRLEESQ